MCGLLLIAETLLGPALMSNHLRSRLTPPKPSHLLPSKATYEGYETPALLSPPLSTQNQQLPEARHVCGRKDLGMDTGPTNIRGKRLWSQPQSKLLLCDWSLGWGYLKEASGSLPAAPGLCDMFSPAVASQTSRLSGASKDLPAHLLALVNSHHKQSEHQSSQQIQAFNTENSSTEALLKRPVKYNVKLHPPAAQIFRVCENNILTHKLPDPVHLQICYLKCTKLILKELTYGNGKSPQRNE